MLNSDKYIPDDQERALMIPEEFNIQDHSDAHYLRVEWFVEDPLPEASWYETSVGPCPKVTVLFDGLPCMRSDISIISRS